MILETFKEIDKKENANSNLLFEEPLEDTSGNIFNSSITMSSVHGKMLGIIISNIYNFIPPLIPEIIKLD
jgi:hypothetical protein